MTALDPDARKVLEERARVLARPLPQQSSELGDGLELLAFTRSGSAYAVPAATVVEIAPAAVPTPLPWVPPAVLGVVNHRGRIVPLVDVARLAAGGAGADGEAGFTVVVAVGAAALALSADAVTGVERIAREDVRPGGELGIEDGGAPVAGVTPALAAILDVEALVRDPRVEVNEEIE